MPKRSKAAQQQSLFSTEEPEANPTRPYDLHSQILTGTSAFTADGWSGTFYPVGMKPAQYLGFYATKFRTVEVDSTFYGTPKVSTVESWNQKTPSDFTFAVKVPQIITHEKVLRDCDAEFDEFIETMSLLGNKLGPIVFQFPQFDKWAFKSSVEFIDRFRLFLKRLSDLTALRFVIEIRNHDWLDAAFMNLLREHNVALALTDTSFMPRPWEITEPLDLITADFVYVRWLGDRKGIETQTTTWDKTIVDRTPELTNWVQLFRQFVSRNLKVYAYANNHYAGHGPGTVKLFWELYDKG
jgi:uncharacterized protein YecE (DUF72 family)